MIKIKRLVAAVAAIVLMCSVALTSYAEIDRKYITDMLFESDWENELEGDYYHFTKSTVKIENNPLAAMYYMTMEAFVSDCDDELLQLVVDNTESPRNFLRLYFEEWDYEATKKKNDYYGNSLLFGREFGVSDYQYGIWEFFDRENNVFNGRFIEDATTFTLIDNETEEVLGVYNKLIGYEYLDYSGYDAGGTGAGGSDSVGTRNPGSPSDNTSDNTVSSYSIESDPNMKKTIKETSETESVLTPNIYGNVSAYDTDNPAVTPEIVSAVDAAKSAAADDEGIEVQGTSDVKATLAEAENKNNTGRYIIIVIVVLLVIAAAFYFIMKNKKGGNSNGNNVNKV